MRRMSFRLYSQAALAVLSGLVISLPAFAQIKIEGAWVRATVSQQKATGAFLSITSSADARLVSAHSPAAAIVEIHEMQMEQDVMKMRPVQGGLELPAGKTVELKPGGYHVMLIDLKAPVTEGQQVPLALVVESREGVRERIEIVAPVRPLHQMGHPTHHK